VIAVLDFSFGERGAAVDAPVDRLLAFVDEPLLHESAERTRDRRLVPEVHRDVGVIPVAEDAEALELFGHHADESLGVGAAGAAKVGHRHVAALRPQLALDTELDRQAVAVVSGHVRRIEARHRSRLDDEILEDLVEGRAEVDLAVRVRRTVVQHELRSAVAAFGDLPVEIHRLPAREPLRLGRLQVGLHREVGPGQIDGVLPLGHGYPAIL
jgi:hypothetical protein